MRLIKLRRKNTIMDYHSYCIFLHKGYRHQVEAAAGPVVYAWDDLYM